MENQPLDLNSNERVRNYILENNVVQYEVGLANEILKAIKERNTDLLAWFNQFGSCMRKIFMNANAYRKGLEFGFTQIAFDQYGWLERPEFLEKESLTFGNSEKYGEHSIIHLGRGINHIWTTTSYTCYGMAGGGSTISVYDKQYPTREAALKVAISQLKEKMLANIGNSDRTNFNQTVILNTLKAIEQHEINSTQLTLF